MLPDLRARYDFTAIGTQWSIHSGQPIDARQRDRVSQLIEDFDRTYSRFRDDSLVCRAAHGPGSWVFPDDVVSLVDLYRTLFDVTDGAMTPLVGGALETLGYGRGLGSGGDLPLVTAGWDEAMAWEGCALTTTAPVLLDFGAGGKGLLVDHVFETLADDDLTVDASGDLRHRGPALRVGLEHPLDPDQAIGLVEVTEGALCASATNRRVWGDGLHHVLDARTGEPVRTVAATWVLAADAMTADALATALFLVDADVLRDAGLLDTGSVDYVVMYADGHARWSSTLPGEVFR